jgi:hypothetical protein
MWFAGFEKHFLQFILYEQRVARLSLTKAFLSGPVSLYRCIRTVGSDRKEVCGSILQTVCLSFAPNSKHWNMTGKHSELLGSRTLSIVRYSKK